MHGLEPFVRSLTVEQQEGITINHVREMTESLLHPQKKRESTMIAMRKKLRKPLGEFVDCFWYSNGERRPYEKERVLPTGCVDLIFKLREDKSVRVFENDSAKPIGGAVVSGVYTRHFTIDTTQPSPTIGVHFKPAGAAPFLALPVSEVMDQHICLEELWGQQAGVMRERLTNAKSVASMFRILEQGLLERMAEPSHDFRVVTNAVDKFASSVTLNVNAVRESMGFSAKRFIRRFHEAVGITPKRFCRIQRFQTVLDRMLGDEPIQWVNVALDNGYFDQSHLIRDFREFSGVTPMEYQPVETGQKNHMVPKP